MKTHPYTGVMPLGDFNNLNDTRLRSYPLKQVVRMATRRSAILDKIFTNIHSLYNPPKVLPHQAIMITMLSFMSQSSYIGITQVNQST